MLNTEYDESFKKTEKKTMIIKHLHDLHVAEDLWGLTAIATLSHSTLCLAYWTVSATLHFKLIRFCSNLDVGQNTVQSGHYCLVGYIKAHQRLFLTLVGGTLTHLEHLSCTKCTFKAFGRPCCRPVKGVTPCCCCCCRHRAQRWIQKDFNKVWLKWQHHPDPPSTAVQI